MAMYGSCDCNNIEITWHIADCTLTPRACQCDYCQTKSAAYTSQSGTAFEAIINNSQLHRIVRHGSNSALFHECANCDQILFVTTEIDGELYGVINARHLTEQENFSPAVQADFSGQTVEQKRERWQQNWCHPVVIIS